MNLYHAAQGDLDSEYDQIKSGAEASGLDNKEALLMYRRIERTEKSVSGLAGKVDSLVEQLDRIERAKSKRRETMSKLLENITEVSLYVYLPVMQTRLFVKKTFSQDQDHNLKTKTKISVFKTKIKTSRSKTFG